MYNIHIFGKVSCNNLKIKMCNIILKENTLFLKRKKHINTKNVRRNTYKLTITNIKSSNNKKVTYLIL